MTQAPAGLLPESAVVLTDEQRGVLEALRSFARDRVAPRAEQLDRDGGFPRESFEGAAEMGILGMAADEAYGGTGLGLVERCLATEELAAVCASTAVVVMHQADLVVANLARNATPQQQARWLPPLCDGTAVGCLAMTEPEAGSDVLGMRTTATEVEGGWLLTGQKTFITNAPDADIVLVYAKMPGERRRSLGLFLVEASSPGLSKGRTLEKMGWHGCPTGELFFERCFVAADQLIGPPGGGVGVMLSGLDTERLIMAAQGVGMIRAALEAASGYAGQRRQFGQRIGDFQLVQQKLADIYVDLQVTRSLTYRAAALADAGGAAELNMLAAAAKLSASEAAVRAASQAVQVHGGYGYMREYGVERLMRDAKILEIGGGTSEILRTIIGKRLVVS